MAHIGPRNMRHNQTKHDIATTNFRKAETTKVLLLFNACMQLCALIEITLARAMRNTSTHLVWVTINTQYLVSSSTSND